MADEQDDYVQIDNDNGNENGNENENENRNDSNEDLIAQLRSKISQLEQTNKQLASQRANHSDENGLMQQVPLTKQQSHQQWTDSTGHTREVSMPGFHKQFTMNFADEINDLREITNEVTGDSNINNNNNNNNDITIETGKLDIDPNDPGISSDLRKAYVEIQQLQKQLSQFTEQARDERALIWEKPRLTIQQISTFLRKLPDKHKEKMWERHCMGDFVKTEKVGSLLFSIVALCIKIHDRNVKTPQKGSLLKKLEPYTKLIQSQINSKVSDSSGLTQSDFSDNLHEWLLLPLPIENLLNSTDRDKLESELFETKKALIEKDKEIFKERRKSKIFQESLAEVQKETERYENEKERIDREFEESTRRQSQIIGEKQQMQLELVDKENTIKDQSTRIRTLEEQVVELTNRVNRSLTRDSEDDNELPERQPNGHTYYSETNNNLILDKPKSHIVANSNTFEEEKMDYSINDSNITKSDIYIGWKRKAEKMQELLNKERENKKELEQKIHEYELMAEAYIALQATNSAWKEKVQKMTDEMSQFDKSHKTNSTVRRESIAALHNTIAQGVVFAEAEHEKIVSGYERQIHNLTTDLNYITNGFEKYKVEIDEKMNEHRESIETQIKQKYENILNQTKNNYETQLNDESKKRINLENELKQISKNINEMNDLQNENNNLQNENSNLQNDIKYYQKQIEDITRKKTESIKALAESMQVYRDMLKKYNARQ